MWRWRGPGCPRLGGTSVTASSWRRWETTPCSSPARRRFWICGRARCTVPKPRVFAWTTPCRGASITMCGACWTTRRKAHPHGFRRWCFRWPPASLTCSFPRWTAASPNWGADSPPMPRTIWRAPAPSSAICGPATDIPWNCPIASRPIRWPTSCSCAVRVIASTSPVPWP